MLPNFIGNIVNCVKQFILLLLTFSFSSVVLSSISDSEEMLRDRLINQIANDTSYYHSIDELSPFNYATNAQSIAYQLLIRANVLEADNSSRAGQHGSDTPLLSESQRTIIVGDIVKFSQLIRDAEVGNNACTSRIRNYWLYSYFNDSAVSLDGTQVRGWHFFNPGDLHYTAYQNEDQCNGDVRSCARSSPENYLQNDAFTYNSSNGDSCMFNSSYMRSYTGGEEPNVPFMVFSSDVGHILLALTEASIALMNADCDQTDCIPSSSQLSQNASTTIMNNNSLADDVMSYWYFNKYRYLPTILSNIYGWDYDEFFLNDPTYSVNGYPHSRNYFAVNSNAVMASAALNLVELEVGNYGGYAYAAHQVVEKFKQSSLNYASVGGVTGVRVRWSFSLESTFRGARPEHDYVDDLTHSAVVMHMLHKSVNTDWQSINPDLSHPIFGSDVLEIHKTFRDALAPETTSNPVRQWLDARNGPELASDARSFGEWSTLALALNKWHGDIANQMACRSMELSNHYVGASNKNYNYYLMLSDSAVLRTLTMNPTDHCS